MDTEITFETVSVSEFWSSISEVLSFQHIVCLCGQMCTGVYADVGLVTPASIHLLYRWHLHQVLCFAGQYNSEQAEVVPVHSSAQGRWSRGYSTMG